MKKVLAPAVVLFLIANVFGCRQSDKPASQSSKDSNTSGMMAPNPTVPGGSLDNPAVSNGMEINDDDENAPHDHRGENLLPGMTVEQGVLMDVGHVANPIIRPGPAGFQVDLRYEPGQLAKLMKLPQTYRPTDPGAALKIWLSYTPPFLPIPPHMTPAEATSIAKNNGKIAIVNFISTKGHEPCTATLTKERLYDDSAWVVTHIEEMRSTTGAGR